LSTATIQPNAGEWKQEVNRRLAAHRERRGLATQPAGPAPAHRDSDPRAAQAKARVAARFRQAPSYEQMQAAEARAALREAEVATQVALEAQAKAQAVLASLQQAAPPQPQPAWQPEPFQPAPSAADPFLSEPFQSAPAQPDWTMEPSGWTQEPSAFAAPEPAQPSAWSSEPMPELDPIQPLAANLIEFPRPLVATRRVRPRLAEGPLASVEGERQLSIFEVDPQSVSSAPEPAAPAPAAAPSWTAPDWSQVVLEAQPEPEFEPAEPEPLPRPRPALEQVSLGRRLQAAVVDGSLLVGLMAGILSLLASRLDAVPSLRSLETGSAVALCAGFLVYHVLFGLMGLRTPGMVYARVAACAFDGRRALPEQMRLRALALPASILPLGLGFLWSLFDEQHLCWHDRLSSTYLRKA
jgi:uncharacterized RDD family membrane protein YckC